MMNPKEREVALRAMDAAATSFYVQAVRCGNHPFIEFTGLIREYIKACEQAHADGIDFTDCSTHTGQLLPFRRHNWDYIQEKLDCIFDGRVAVKTELVQWAAG